jgi:TetR/AcrR family transcriptional repressor of mexJK operon
MSNIARSRTGGRPTLAEGQQLTERIVTTAQEQFLTFGYHDTSFEGIAAAVGVHKGALYVRFADKFSLFAEVCARLVERLYRADVVTLTDDLPMRNSLRKQAMALVTAATNPTTIALWKMVVANVPQNPELAKTSVKIWHFYVSQLTSYFQSRIERRLLHLIDPVGAAEIFAGMIFSRIHVWVVHGIDMPTPDELKHHVDRAILVFLGGIGRLELEGDMAGDEPVR